MTVPKVSIDAAASLDALHDVAKTSTFEQLSAGEVASLARRLRQLAPAPDIRIAYLANHTVDPLPDYVGVRNLCASTADSAFVAPYNQYFQTVLDARSELGRFEPELLILSLSLRELAPRIATDFMSLSPAALDAERARIIQHVVDWVAAAKEATRAHILVCNFASPAHWQAGIADQKSGLCEQAFHLRLNLDLLERLRTEPRVHILDVERILAAHGKARSFSPKLYYLARMEWQEGALSRLAEEIHRYVQVILGRSRKCLVLDLDNTLWGGILGEDGVEGIKIGKGSAIGEAFLVFQHHVRGLKHRGVILALASKNNYEDVAEAFDSRPDMPLKLGDFAAVEIGWQNKHESLLRIAKTLNIGTDSLVFVDDSPAECALIRKMLPEVEVAQLEGDPADFVGLLQRMTSFERLEITNEDRRKTQSYLESRQRADLQKSIASLEDYLKDLDTRIVIRRPGERDAARVHQLFNKTNQFNVTTKRYTPADVATFMTNDSYDLRVVDVADRFGDLGTVGLVLIDRSESEARVDSFVLSCRAMGRQVETAIINTVKRDYLLSGRSPALTASYIPTQKNKPVERFYDAQGFAVVEERPDGERAYRLTADRTAPLSCDHITVGEDP